MSKLDHRWQTIAHHLVVFLAFSALFGVYALTGGFYHDEWGYFGSSDANLSARARDLFEPLNEHFQPFGKLVLQIVFTIFGPHRIGLGATNFLLAAAVSLLTFALTSRMTGSRLAAFIGAGSTLFVHAYAMEAIVWPAAGAALYLTIVGFLVIALDMARPEEAKRGWFGIFVGAIVMVFSSSAFPAFVAATVGLAAYRFLQAGRGIITMSTAIHGAYVAGICVALAVLDIFLGQAMRQVFAAPAVNVPGIDLSKIGSCLVAPLSSHVPIPLVIGLFGISLPFLIFGMWSKGSKNSTSSALCVIGLVIYFVGVAQIFIGRYSVIGCAAIESRHLLIPLVGSALYAGGVAAILANLAPWKLNPILSNLAIAFCAIGAFLIAPLVVNEQYRGDFLADRQRLGASQATFLSAADDVICAAERLGRRGAYSGRQVVLPDPSMASCLDSCGLGITPPFNMKEYGFGLSTFAAASHSACLSRRFIGFAPIEVIPAGDRAILASDPAIGAFYQKYFGLGLVDN